MAFQIRCPACSKLYAAEERMIGKKMRCKACGSAFPIEAPEREPSLSASVAGSEVQALSSSDLTGTRKAQRVPPLKPLKKADVAAEKLQRPSSPQNFPGVAIVEAWLPLALGLLSAVWVISQTFGANGTGRLWVPVLRVGVIALLYLGLVIPITYMTVRSSFRAMKRMPPPNPLMRTAQTFAFPAALGYEMWQASEGVGGLFTGLILGVVLMAAVYWLLFRLNQQEAANSYAKVGGVFLAGCGVSALILVGASALLNKAMIAGRAGNVFSESPLGEPLAWTVQAPEPRPVVRPSDQSVASPQPPESAAPQPKTSSPVETPAAIASKAEKSAPTVPATVDLKAPEKGVAESVANPPAQAKSEVFASPDDDSFTDSIRKNRFPWVKSINRADGQGSFDFTVSSSGRGKYIGLVSLPGGKLGRQVLLAPINAAVPPFQDDVEQAGTFGARYVLTNDGKALIHLKSDNNIEVIPTAENHPEPITLENPSSTIPLKPSLVGTSKGTTFVVRWTGPGSMSQFVYRYDYLTRSNLRTMPIPVQPRTSPVVCSVSDNETGPVYYAWLSQAPGRTPQVEIVDVTAAALAPHAVSLPSDVSDVSLFERGEMSFSPDGSMLAMVLEDGNTARVLVWPTENPSPPTVHLLCKCPSSSEMSGHVRGPSVRWINRTHFVVYGRTVIGTVKPGVVGTLSDADTLITGEQTTPDNKLYVCYMLPDTHLHLAAIEFDLDALDKAPVVLPAGH